ncbi:MAG: DUF177 domain-containing protein [Sphingobium sp.]
MSAEPVPEFSRPVRADQIDRAAEVTTIGANAAERAALAKRFGLIALDRLEADYSLTREGDGVLARGRMRATLAQPCVATAAPVPETIATDFTLRFVSDRATAAEGEEIELDVEDYDIIGYDGLSLDMGEAVAETMALAMEPYPRAPDADTVLRAAGVLTEEQASPFAALLALKDGTPPKG